MSLHQDPAIGAAVDEVRLMGYDYHWNGSPPEPIAPITWIREVLTYAKTQISPQKIVLGYLWPATTGSTATARK
ncbi:MAG: hypothetical protein ACRDQI_13280 [Pseudonocardiaceae bacterium]